MKMQRPIGLLSILLAGFFAIPTAKAVAYTLTVTADHGSVTVSPSKQQYDEGEVVELIPGPEVGYCFRGWSGDAHGKRLVLNLTMDGNKAITANFGTWTPPIGIPMPEFGIFETYRMYDDPAKRNSSLTYTQNSEGGYYTHYIDNTHPDATDTSNPYGTASKPRYTVPRPLEPGSIVEIHGGPYTYGQAQGKININGDGTEAQPIVVRGVGTPQFGNNVNLYGAYIIFEGFYFYNYGIRVRNSSDLSAYYHHISIRNCHVEGDGTTGGGGGIGAGSNQEYIVIYANHIHHYGQYDTPLENDRMGTSCGRTHYIWIVDNHIHHNGGDSFQVGHGGNQLSNHIYVGRNVMHDDGENAIDLKDVTDVIVSENTMYSYFQPGNPSADNTITVSHYGPSDPDKRGTIRAWFLYNEMYNAQVANQVSSGPQDIYFIGNVIHDIDNYAYVGWSHEDVFLIGNTMYNIGKGIDDTGSTDILTIANNSFGMLSGAGPHIKLSNAEHIAAAVVSNNLFQEPRNINTGCDSCIEADPLFVNAADENFHLEAGSPAIDAATSSGVVQQVFDTFQQLYGIDIRKDIEGRARPQGSAWDIGAYEYVVEAVSDLAVPGTSQNSITLGWTVPGEGGVTGTPNRYDIRYAGSAITEANWEAATQVQGEPVAGGFGSQQSFTITGLNPGATYYVAMKVGDEAGHFSQLSNVISRATASSGNHAPVVTPIGDRSVAVNGTLTFTVSATDADAGDTLTYSATGLPAGANFTPGTQTFTWTPTNLQSGRYRVMFQVSDSHVTVSETITITVREGSNEAPVLGAIGDKSTDENELLSFSVSATDQDGDSLTFSATGRPSGATFVSGAFTWTPNYSQAGSYQVTFTVSDGELTDSEQITITVANVTDQTAPVADEVFPPPDAVQVPVNPVITFALTDLGLGIDPNTVALRVSDQLVYTGNSILYNSPDGICRRTGNPMNYRYYFFPNDPFDFDQPVPVLVNASDLAHNAMTPLSYQFVTEMRSFGQNQLVSSNSGSSGHPAIATDSGGNLWAAWHTGQPGAGDIYVAKRGSDAQQWAAPFRLTNLDSDQRNPAMAIGSNDTLYVTWQDNRRGNWDIYVAVSLDGVTWNDPVRLTDPNTNETNPAIAIDHASPNHVYIAWQQDEGAGNQDIYVASSSTRFISKAVTQVTSHAASQTEPALAVGSDNTVYLVWTDRRNGSADIYGSSSSAVSWANVAIVTGAGNQSDPTIAVEPDSSSLHVLWVSDTTGNLDIVVGVSNGLPAAPISGSVVVDDTTGADQSAPAVLAVKDHWNRGHIYACWQDNRSVADSGDSDLYFAEIRSGEAGTNILVGDDGANSNQSDPVLGFDRYGEPVVLWVDDRGGTAQIYGACSTYSDPVSLASGTIPSSTGGRVGPDPASIGDDSDVSIGIPSHALGCDALLAISRLRNAQAFGAPCLASYEISPSGIQFSPPATVVIPYVASGSGPATPYWYDAQTGMLSQLGITGITRTTLPNGLSVVSFNTTHLTSFYVLEGSSVVGGGGGGGGCALSRAREGSVVGYVLPYGALALLLFVRRWMDGRRKGDSERASAPQERAGSSPTS